MPILSNVMRIDFTVDHDYKSENLLALFNINKISEDEVNKFIHEYYIIASIRGVQVSHPDIIIMSLEQLENVFCKEEE